MLVGDTFERYGTLAAQIEAFARHTSASHVSWRSWRGWLRGQLIQRTLQCHVLPIFIKRTKCYDYILRHQLAGFDI